MENAENRGLSPEGDRNERLELAPSPFVESLSEDERMLLVVRRELYESSWDRMEQDLRNRLSGKPYIFKLVNRIEADLATIQFLRTYEAAHSIDLDDLVGGDDR